VKVKHCGPPAPRLADIRARWLHDVIGSLRADRSVVGSALVGSLGDGRADDWSDVDLLVVVEDAVLDEYGEPDHLPIGPGRASFTIDARHNGPVGTRALSAQYVVEGLPLWVDWHVHPVSLARWPSDSTVIFDRSGIDLTSVTFSEYLDRGRHESAIPSSADDHQALRLALVPVLRPTVQLNACSTKVR
jgi:predicted nucleotidyltransferase